MRKRYITSSILLEVRIHTLTPPARVANPMAGFILWSGIKGSVVHVSSTVSYNQILLCAKNVTSLSVSSRGVALIGADGMRKDICLTAISLFLSLNHS